MRIRLTVQGFQRLVATKEINEKYKTYGLGNYSC